MALTINHSYTAIGTDAGTGEVNKARWNAALTYSGTLDVANGGTGASDAATARTNLGLGTGDSPTFTDITLSGVGNFSAGTALLPSLAASGDTNTGMWFPAADTIAWSTGGTERFRIRSDGNVSIGSTGSAAVNLFIGRNMTGAINAQVCAFTATVQSDVTNQASGFYTGLSTAAASFTLGTMNHFHAFFQSLGASSAITNQRGFFSGASLVQATNNYAFYADNTASVASAKTAYGFFSAINTATGGGTTWQFYGDGTAPSYHRGNFGIAATSFGSSAAGVLAIGTSTAPTTGPADTIQIYSTDLSAGNTILSLYTEGTPVNANTTAATTHRIAIRVNGTVYYLLANTSA